MNILSFIAAIALLSSNTDDPFELSVRQGGDYSQYYAYEIMEDFFQNENAIDDEDAVENCDDFNEVTAFAPGIFFSNLQDVMPGGQSSEHEYLIETCLMPPEVGNMGKPGLYALVAYDLSTLARQTMDSQSVCTMNENDFATFITSGEGGASPADFSYMASDASVNLPEGEEIAAIYPHSQLTESVRSNSLYPLDEWRSDQSVTACDLNNGDSCSIEGREEMASLLKMAGVMNYRIYKAAKTYNYQTPSHTLDMGGCMTVIRASGPHLYTTEVQPASCVPNTSWLRYVEQFKSGFLLGRSDQALIKNDQPFFRICKIRNSQLFGMSSSLVLLHTEPSDSDEIICKLEWVRHDRSIGVRFLHDDSQLTAVNDCEMFLERYELRMPKPYNEYRPEGSDIGCEEKMNMLARGVQKGSSELKVNGGKGWNADDKTLFGTSLVLLGHFVAGIYWLQVPAAIGEIPAQKSLARALIFQARESRSEEQRLHAYEIMESIDDDEARLLLAMNHSLSSCNREEYDQNRVTSLLNQVTDTGSTHHNVLMGMIFYFRGGYADAVTILYPHALNGHYSAAIYYCKSAVRLIKSGVSSKHVCRDINNLAQTIGTDVSDFRYARSHCSSFVITGMPDFIIALIQGNDDAINGVVEYAYKNALPMLMLALASAIPDFMRNRMVGAFFVLLGKANAHWRPDHELSNSWYHW